MNVLLSWLQEFAPFDADPSVLAENMTDLGMVVESVTDTGPSWDGIVVAKVLDLRPHPQADRIQLVDVDAGDGEALQVCCGAFNMAVGDLVPLAMVGTVMPGGLEIGRRKMRGEWSNGMLCSPSELDLDGDADGIHILDAASLAGGSAMGTPLVDALAITSDVLFELDIEGNRPDALSVMGVARDLAARMGVKFTPPEPDVVESDSKAADRCSASIIDPALCQRFGLRVLDNITVGESPPWMASRLIAAGMRPINTIVDISNYVMLEVGQPNHTYDLALVPDGHLGVRRGRDGEQLVTLDDIERTVNDADGLIVNAADEAIGLAGVMGGASTEISDATTSVVVEAAVWDRMTVAKTSRKLNLRSEASVRFERGADPYVIELALDRFCQLAQQLCGATVATGRVTVEGDLKPAASADVRLDKVNELLNTDLTAEQAIALLNPIGYNSTVKTPADGAGAGAVITSQIPSWRPDSSTEIDVVEEIARHHGYSKSGLRVPTPTQAGRLSPTQQARRRVRRAILGAGYSEAMPLPFLAPGDLARAGLADTGLRLVNPLVADESVLRTSLLPGLLKAVLHNQSHRNGPVRLYELGRIFQPSDDELPVEMEILVACRSGFEVGDRSGRTSASAAATELLAGFADELNLTGLSISNAEVPGLHPTRAATVQFRGATIGAVGEVDPAALERFEIQGRVSWLELQLAPLVPAIEKAVTYKPVSFYPSSDVDLAFVVADEVPAADVLRTLNKAGGDLLFASELFDTFRSDQLGADRRSLAYRLRFQAGDRTLTDAEVSEVRQRCIDAVQKAHQAELR